MIMMDNVVDLFLFRAYSGHILGIFRAYFSAYATPTHVDKRWSQAGRLVIYPTLDDWVVDEGQRRPAK